MKSQAITISCIYCEQPAEITVGPNAAPASCPHCGKLLVDMGALVESRDTLKVLLRVVEAMEQSEEP